MRKIVATLILLISNLGFASNQFECDSSQLTFEIQTYLREGNEEGRCPIWDDYPSNGTPFMFFNGQPINFFSHGETRDFCTGTKDTAPTPYIWRGCVSKGFINRTGVNIVNVTISNSTDEAFVNNIQSAYVLNGGSIFLMKWSRQGKGRQQVFNGQTSVSLSSFVLSTSGYESAQRLVNFRSILDRLVDLRLINSKELETWHSLLDGLLDRDPRTIDLNSLPSNTPTWFRDLIKSIQQGSEATELEHKNLDKNLEKSLSSNQQKIAESLASLDLQVSESEVEDKLKLDQEEIDDGQIKAREHNYLILMQSMLDASNRGGFLQSVYDWEEESKTATDVAIELNVDKPGYYQTFLSSQTRIMEFVRKIVDENYYFRDIPVSDAFKSLVENGLRSRNPELAKKIKDLINLKYKRSAAGDKALRHLEVVVEGYASSSDRDNIQSHALLIDDMLQFLEKAQDFVECIAKTNVAGLYASFYEVVEGRSFCDDSPLDNVDRTISFVDFGATLSGKLGFTLGTGVSAAITLKKIMGSVAPIFRKFGVNRIAEITQGIISYAGKVKLSSIPDFLTRVKNTILPAKKLGLDDPKEIESFIKLVDRIENANPQNIVDYELLRTSLAIEEIKGAKLVGSALKTDALHAIPAAMIDLAAKEGKVTSLKGGDKVVRNLLQVEGSVNGQKGIFEWICGPEGLTHQRFIKDGLMTGFPNQVPQRLP